MYFSPPLQPATLIRRYKRFLADVILHDGQEITIHTANTGAMTGCAETGMRIWLSHSDNPRRRYPYSWELSEIDKDVLVCVNTARANNLVAEAIESGVVGELQDFNRLRREVAFGQENSRVDLLLENSKTLCYVEVKNVTLAENGVAAFPDAPSRRGTKHLRELMYMASQGHRAVVFFCVARPDVKSLRPADEIDPHYGDTLRQAADHDVEILAYSATVTPRHVCLVRPLAVEL